MVKNKPDVEKNALKNLVKEIELTTQMVKRADEEVCKQIKQTQDFYKQLQSIYWMFLVFIIFLGVLINLPSIIRIYYNLKEINVVANIITPVIFFLMIIGGGLMLHQAMRRN